ncbi:MAG: 2-succinyl-5-enolpyruvyl-6-hydroxy-3-cyclohexene-1-carboxylic-acid synthase [Cyclobacteriaceae bacterium]
MNQTIYDTSELCYQLGVRHAVFSPGSRNAPLSISFHRNKKISTHVFVDERSAGFIGLGISQRTQSPVVLCCTSGTALLNYGPAIAEAFYQEIPLIVLSADRPPEWIDQWDGQTIRQQNVFSNFVKHFQQLPDDLANKSAQSTYQKGIIEAIKAAVSDIKGPVHLNIPFREPFYPAPDSMYEFSEISIEKTEPRIFTSDSSKIVEDWKNSEKKLVLVGQGNWDQELKGVLGQIIKKQVPVIGDIISNVHDIEGVISHQDLFLSGRPQLLQPELVITLGKSLISKQLKLFLRAGNFKHYHLAEHPGKQDPFSSKPIPISCRPKLVLEELANQQEQEPDFSESWSEKNKQTKAKLAWLETCEFGEFSAFKTVISSLPQKSIIHLSNSMPVRYANFLSTHYEQNIDVFANRGTSGIDGSNATAVGHALTSDRQVVLLTGDLSFIYDQNAFFHEYALDNLRIVVFNNFGGGIFDMIPGPLSLSAEERTKHFNTPHQKNFKYMARNAGFDYQVCDQEDELNSALRVFFNPSDRAKLLEIQSDRAINQKVFQAFKQYTNE